MDDLFSQASVNQNGPENIQVQIEQLRTEVERHDRLYYDQATPEISDAEYDKLFRKLEELEERHPEFNDPNSPTQRVGSKALDSFEQVSHLKPMLSIDDVFTEEEVSDFFARLQKNLGKESIPVSIEPKIDGVAVSLVYRNGLLDYAATRGDGQRGDVITNNVRTIKKLPLKLGAKAPPLFEIRGEIYMPNAAFAKMNEERDEAGLQTFVNPRNATAGTLKQLDSKEVAKRPLAFLAHGLGAIEGIILENDKTFLNLLDQFKIPRNLPIWEASNLKEILNAIHELDEKRHHLDYGTDGAVIKVLDHSDRATLGSTSRAPRWAAAFKYPAEQKETLLKKITIQVGRTGVLTPVAELDPVFVSGSTVSRATLHNQDEINRKDIRLGDTVVIEKAGEIIPAVVRVVKDKREPNSKPFDLAEFVNHQCPSCQGPITQEEGLVAWRCNNFTCPAQAVTSLTHFSGRKALDIDGLGESIAIKLVEYGTVKSILDLFTLDAKSLANLELDAAKLQGGGESKARRLGEKRAETILNSLEYAKTNMPLNRWIFAMGIPHVGESTSKELARLHKNLNEVFSSQILRDLANLPNYEELSKSKRTKENHPGLTEYKIDDSLGPVAAESLVSYFESEAGKLAISRFEELGINPTSEIYAPKPADLDTSNLPLLGKTFVITGTLSKPRPEFKKLIESKGGKVSGSVSKNTHYLLAGEAAGSKQTKAEDLGITILDEKSLEDLLTLRQVE